MTNVASCDVVTSKPTRRSTTDLTAGAVNLGLRLRPNIAHVREGPREGPRRDESARACLIV